MRPNSNDRWYVPLMIAGAVVIALLVACVAALEVFAARAASEAAPTGWHLALANMDDAIAHGDIAGAAADWREAHVLARRSRQWEALIDVGDGYRQVKRFSDRRAARTRGGRGR